MGHGLIWSIVGCCLSGGGLVFSYCINKRTLNIKEEMTLHAKNKAFAKVRKGCITRLIYIRRALPLIEGEDRLYFDDKVRKLDEELATVETQCMTLTDEHLKKIEFIRSHIKAYFEGETKGFDYGSIAQELNDIISKLEGEENYDQEL